MGVGPKHSPPSLFTSMEEVRVGGTLPAFLWPQNVTCSEIRWWVLKFLVVGTAGILGIALKACWAHRGRRRGTGRKGPAL